MRAAFAIPRGCCTSALRPSLKSSKKLGRQNKLEEILLEGREGGFRITTKAIAAYTLLPTVLQLLPQCLPLLGVVWDEFLGCKGPQPCGRARSQAHGAAPPAGG